MSRYKNEITHLQSHIRTLRLGTGALLLVSMITGAGWWYAPRELTIHVPPDLRSGSTRSWWEVPPETVYAVTFYVWQQLQRWPTNGDEDFDRNIHTLAPYLTPACQTWLRRDYDYRRSLGELRSRVRGIYEIPGRGYGEDPTLRVRTVSASDWIVTLDVVADEYFASEQVKRALVRYAIKVIDVDLNTIQFDTSRSSQCQVNAPQPNETGWSQSFTTLNNQSAQVPVWWFFMHSISRAVTGAAVAAIPCGTDLRQMRMEVDSTRIDNPLLSQEVADFSADCYGPARAKLFANRPELDDEQMNDVTWIGSRFFLDTPGYYDTYRSKTPRDSWAYDESRDAGLAEVESGAGYPTCEQWWSDEYYGLRTRLLQQVDADLLSRMGNWAGFISREDMDDSVIRAIASPQNQNINRGAVYTDYGGQVEMTLPNILARGAGNIGMSAGSLGFFPAMDVMRQALPMVLSLLKMALVICIPLVLVIGVYDLKMLVVVSVVQFSLFFVDFWFQLARWIDSTILDALYGWGFGYNRPHTNFNPLIGLNNAFGDMLLNFVMATMFIVLPTFWVAALAWAGIRAGGIASAFATGTNPAANAGGKGTGVVSAKLR